MAYFKCSTGGGNSVEIDGVAYDGDLKLVKRSVIDMEYTLPYQYPAELVKCKGEIHILSRYNSDYSYKTLHYKWNKTSEIWESVSTLPYQLYYGCAVVQNDEIHILGSLTSNKYKCHYKFNGSSWVSVSTLPYDFYYGSANVYKDEIHILGGGSDSVYDSAKKHYKYNGSTWTSVSTLPYYFIKGNVEIFDNQIHILGSSVSSCSKYHYKYNGSTWESVSTLPIGLSRYSCNTLLHDNKIIFPNINTINTYEWDGNSWIKRNSFITEIGGTHAHLFHMDDYFYTTKISTFYRHDISLYEYIEKEK